VCMDRARMGNWIGIWDHDGCTTQSLAVDICPCFRFLPLEVSCTRVFGLWFTCDGIHACIWHSLVLAPMLGMVLVMVMVTNMDRKGNKGSR
jgi:hypothetical protein